MKEEKDTHLLVDGLPQNLGGVLGLGLDLLGDIDVEGLVNLSGLDILNAVQKHAEDAEGGGNNAAKWGLFKMVNGGGQKATKGKRESSRGMARVNTLIQDLDLDAGANHAPEGGGEPKLLVVTATAVQADNEAGVADVGLQLLDVEGEILWRNTR